MVDNPESPQSCSVESLNCRSYRFRWGFCLTIELGDGHALFVAESGIVTARREEGILLVLSRPSIKHQGEIISCHDLLPSLPSPTSRGFLHVVTVLSGESIELLGVSSGVSGRAPDNATGAAWEARNSCPPMSSMHLFDHKACGGCSPKRISNFLLGVTTRTYQPFFSVQIEIPFLSFRSPSLVSGWLGSLTLAVCA